MFDTLLWGDDGAEDGGPPAVLLPLSLHGGGEDDARGDEAWGDHGAQYGGPTAVVPSVSPHAESLLEHRLEQLQSQHQQHVQYVLACAEASVEAERQRVASVELEAQTLFARQ
eukprot:830049-Alexandrium_andersonii.AAC.1